MENQLIFFGLLFFQKVDKLPRHPSQLYEATLEGLFFFYILINLIYKNQQKQVWSPLYL